MIKFIRENGQVQVKVDPGTNIEQRLIIFSDDEHAEPGTAEIVRTFLQERFEERIKQIRKEAYDKGWKDAKNKQKKVRSFWPTFKTNEHGSVGL